MERMEDNMFAHSHLKELILSEGITLIPRCMCEYSEELKRVVLPSTIRGIEICAFNCCKQLQEINLPDSIEFIEDGVFRFCESLKQVHLPLNLKQLSPELFYGSGIETIDISDNIKEIGYWALWGCKHLKCLVIPESVKRIGYGIISAHEGFERIDCHAKGFHVENDALIDDNNQELLCCWTQQKHYVVPECVRRIADISGNEFVETITVKQPVELTTQQVFASNINLKSVDFQGGVKGIDDFTFYNCLRLKNNLEKSINKEQICQTKN